MAKIVEYEATTAPSGPETTRQARTEDTGGVGSALASLGGAISQAGQTFHKAEAEAETTQVSAKLADAHVQLSQDLDETLKNSDPNDPNVVEKFMQRYDDTVGKIGDHLNTREGQQAFQRNRAEMRKSFAESAVRGQANNQGQAAVDNTASALSSRTTLVARNPDMLDAVLKEHEASINSLNIPQNAKDELRAAGETALVKAQVQGFADLNPQAAQKMLKDGKWDSYFSADELRQLGHEVNQYVTAERVEKERQQKIQDLVDTQKDNATKDLFLQKLYGNGLSSKEILKSDLSPSDKEHYLNLLDRNNTEKIKTDPSTMINLFQRVHLPDGDPQKITDPDVLSHYFGHGLDITSLQQLRNEIAGKGTPQGQIDSKLKASFLKDVQGQLTKTNPLIGFKDPEGDNQYQAFISKFLPAFEAARKSGKSAETLLDPASPDYMGKMVTPYLRSQQDITRSIFSQFPHTQPSSAPTPPKETSDRLAPGSAPGSAAPRSSSAEPRKPKESAADYLKRIKAH